MLTRKKRLSNFRKIVEKKWQQYFWESIFDYFKLQSISFSNLSRNPNISLEIIMKNPQYPWNYNELSSNSSINFTMVKKTPNLKWNYNFLSLNPSISWLDIKSNIDLSWDWCNLAKKEGITIDIIKLKYTELNPKMLIHNSSVTLEMIENNLDIPWDLNEIILKENILFPDILELMKKYNIKFLEKHITDISSQKNVFWHTVKNYPNIKWNYKFLSCNPNITLEIILKNLDKNWSWKYFSYNPNFKLEYILRFPILNWDWEYISENLLTPFFLNKHPHFPYCKNSIQMNAAFTFQDIIDHPKITPNMCYISLNPGIKLLDIRENLGYRWDWFLLSGTLFKKDKDTFFFEHARQWISAYRIQQWFHKIRHNPHYRYGRKHINNMYLECF